MYIAASASRISSSASRVSSGPKIEMPMLPLSVTCAVAGLHRLGEQLEDPLRRVGGGLALGDVLEQHGELVAAESRGDVRAADAVVEAARELDEHLVAGGVAERVVHGLEVVEVEEDHRRRAVLAAARAIAWRTCSANIARFASPVTGSWNAWCASSASNALRSLTSRALSRMPPTCSSSIRFVNRISNWRVSPSRPVSAHSSDWTRSPVGRQRPRNARADRGRRRARGGRSAGRGDRRRRSRGCARSTGSDSSPSCRARAR